MAKTTTSSSEPTNQLRKLLQNHQEPFTLELYLSEKGCWRKNLTSDASFVIGSGKFPIKSGTKNKSKKGIVLHFPKVLKVVLCNMLFTIKGLRTKSSIKQGIIEVDSSGCSALNDSSSDSDVDGSSMFTHDSNSSKLHAEKESKVVVDTDDETISNTEQESFVSPKLITEESILSASLWPFLLQTTSKQQPGCEEFSTSKRVLQQTKQLLLDCVRELVDHSREKKGNSFLGGEEIGKIMCEKIKRWEKQCGDETNIEEMLELDLMGSKREWDDFEVESRKTKIGQLLGNVILEELVNEVVTDMIDVFFK